MQRQQYTVTGVGVSAPFPLDTETEYYKVSFGTKVTGTATYNVEYTLDDVFPDVNNGDPPFVAANAQWYSATGFAAATTAIAGDMPVLATACRLNVTVGTGTVVLQILQLAGR